MPMLMLIGACNSMLYPIRVIRAYGQDTPFTGPVIKNCSVHGEGLVCPPGQPCNVDAAMSRLRTRQITINFNEELLGADAVKVWATTPDTEGLAITTMWNCLNTTCLAACSGNATCAWNCAVLQAPFCQGWAATPIGPSGNGDYPTQYVAQHFHWLTGLTVSPLEVQVNGKTILDLGLIVIISLAFWRILAPYHPAYVVWCVLLSARVCRVLIGACNLTAVSV